MQYYPEITILGTFTGKVRICLHEGLSMNVFGNFIVNCVKVGNTPGGQQINE